jgi:hypothetical protein
MEVEIAVAGVPRVNFQVLDKGVTGELLAR